MLVTRELRLCACALVVLVLPHTAAAQPAPPALTLDDAITRSFETSHRLAQMRAHGEAAEAAIRGRQAERRPEITTVAGYTRTNHVDEFGVPLPDGRLRVIYPDIPSNVHTRMAFRWPIYTGGRLDALERAAQAEAGVRAAEIRIARADLRFEVVRSYWGLATAEEAVKVLESALVRVEGHLAAVRSRFETGLVPPNDVLSVEAQHSRQRMLLIEARNQREASSAGLRRLIGAEPDEALALADRFDSRTPSDDAAVTTPGALVEAALAQRPEREALLLGLASAIQRHEATAAGRWPTVTAAGGVDYANPNPRLFPRRDVWRESWDVSVHVGWILWDGGRTAAARAEAVAGIAASRARLADFDEGVSTEVRLRLLDLDSSQAAVAASADGMRAAAEARRVVDERFAVGIAVTTDVLDAQIALLQAELDRTRALASVRLAEAHLERALGQ